MTKKTNVVPLTLAGYRERAFAKALLASNGIVDRWGDVLTQWSYDSSSDELVDLDGARTKVLWEGSRSREILLEHQVDESGLNAPVQGVDADAEEYVSGIAAAVVSSPVDGDERRLLLDAHELACARLGVPAKTSLDEARVLSRGTTQPRLPRLVTVVVCLTSSLLEQDGEWLTESPWEDADLTREEWVALVAVSASARAESVTGALALGDDAELLSRISFSAAVDAGADPECVVFEKLRARVALALAEARATLGA